MSQYFIVVALAVTILSGCTNNSQPDKPTSPICQQKAMPGSWHEAQLTAEVQQAVNTLMDRINNASPLKSVNQVRTQVVNGTNYAIEVQLENGEYWHGIVYRNIRGDYLIDSLPKQGQLCP